MQSGPAQSTTARTALWRITFAMIGGLIVVVAFSAAQAELTKALFAAGAGLAVAGASAVMGGLLGFLFAIPRALQATDTSAGSGPSASQSSRARYGQNTNLEQISDWLTKILVGVGLTQLSTVPDRLHDLALFLSPAFGDGPRPDVFAIALVLYFVICGFLFGYLWTRLFMMGALDEAERAAMDKAQTEAERQSALDTKALTLVRQQLSASATSRQVSEQELKSLLTEVSDGTRSLIRGELNAAPRPERAITVLRALIDQGDNPYDDHRQLGYHYQNIRQPDWAASAKEFDDAIGARPQYMDRGYDELQRALARINLERNHKGASANREEILTDLKAGANVPELRIGMKEDPLITTWLEKNGLGLDSLIPSVPAESNGGAASET